MNKELDIDGVVWHIGAEIGEGGFGSVCEATAAGFPRCVAKFVPRSTGANREVDFTDFRNTPNVLPVLASVETPEEYILIMPRASHSLADEISKQGGPFPTEEALTILAGISAGVSELAALDEPVVHRDLKPNNVLFRDGRWEIADFGISRFANADTAIDTMKSVMTVGYAAPEQWSYQRATPKTDVYALGVIAYQLLMGNLPFSPANGEWSEFRRMHLHETPPDIDHVPPSLASLVGQMLMKSPESRPTAAEVSRRIGRISREQPRPGLERLASANHVEVQRLSAVDAERARENEENQRRITLYKESRHLLGQYMDEFRSQIQDVATAARLNWDNLGGWRLTLEDAILEVRPTSEVHRNSWGLNYAPDFEVIAFSGIRLQRPVDQYGYSGRSHSLWYCDAITEGEFHWIEVAFMRNPLITQRAPDQCLPFALDPGAEAGQALSSAMSGYQVAWPMTVLNDESLDAFTDVWAERLALAATGGLRMPNQMPELPIPRVWR